MLKSCPVLKKKDAKSVALVGTQKTPVVPEVPESDECRNYSAFIMNGFVSLEDGGDRVPVSILCDTGATQSFILDSVLPFSGESSVGSSVPVVVPLHTVSLESELVSGRVTVGLRPFFPIGGVSVILGNDLAGDRVLVTPEVAAVPMGQSPDRLAMQHPRVFEACAVTRAMAKSQAKFEDVVDPS